VAINASAINPITAIFFMIFPPLNDLLADFHDYSRPPLRNRRRWSRGSILAIGFVDLRSHFLQTLTLIHHLHHVTRDVYADRSADAH
jgi:hypothetical protein